MTTFTPTLVRLISNVPFFNDYKHTRSFADSSAQRSYFESKATHTYTDFTYQRHDNSIKVPESYDSLYNCNYVIFLNTPDQNTKYFYAFITRKEYVNPNTTRIFFEIDVYQTWMFEMKWNPSFISREHCTRWDSSGNPIINTQDEGLDYGSEYDVVSAEHVVPYDDVYFLVIGCKQSLNIKVGEDYIINPNNNGITQPLSFYILPMRKNGDAIAVKVGGVSVPTDRAQFVLQKLYESEAAVNNIVSLTITQFIGVNVAYDGTTVYFNTPAFMDAAVAYDGGTTHLVGLMGVTGYGTISHVYSNKYDGYASVTESKLLMHPYTVLVLTDYRGNQIEYKNEYINSHALNVYIKGSIGVNNKVGYYVGQYGGNDTTGEPTWMEKILIDDNPNDVPIITDLLAAYLQGNRNSINMQKAQINYNQNMNLLTGGIGAVTSGIQGGMAGMFMGGPAGAAAGALSGAAGGIGSTLQGYVNHQFELASIMAKHKDISAQPPNISKMGSNSFFDFGNSITGVYLVKKQIKSEYRKKLSDYFKMYGYKLNELKLPNLKTRASFNYVQTTGANISGNIPNDDLFKLKSIFDAGITIWHGDYVGDYARNNDEL